MSTDSLKVVIADDEPLARERLRALLSELPQVVLAAEAADGEQALRACAEHAPDVVLLDIAMPGIDGLEAARHLATFEPPPAVVFCTAYDAHALSAFEAEAVDYLVKPVRAERLEAALARARTMVAGRGRRVSADGRRRRTHLVARMRGGMRLIRLEEVRYLQAEEKYVVVHHARGEDLLEESLKSLEEEFAEHFVRIHRNCLVARKEIIELRRSREGQVSVVLRHGRHPLEVSRRCVAQLREAVKGP